MRLPLELVRAGSKRISTAGETRNVSSSGVLFTTSTPVEVGESIEYLVTLPGPDDQPPVCLRCRGKVVRKEAVEEPQSFSAVAATVERYEFVRT